MGGELLILPVGMGSLVEGYVDKTRTCSWDLRQDGDQAPQPTHLSHLALLCLPLYLVDPRPIGAIGGGGGGIQSTCPPSAHKAHLSRDASSPLPAPIWTRHLAAWTPFISVMLSSLIDQPNGVRLRGWEGEFGDAPGTLHVESDAICMRLIMCRGVGRE